MRGSIDINTILYGHSPRSNVWKIAVQQLNALLEKQGIEEAWQQIVQKYDIKNAPAKQQEKIINIFTYNSLQAVNPQLNDAVFRFMYREQGASEEMEKIRSRTKAIIENKLYSDAILQVDDVLRLYWAEHDENSPYQALIFQAMTTVVADTDQEKMPKYKKHKERLGKRHWQFLMRNPEFYNTPMGKRLSNLAL